MGEITPAAAAVISSAITALVVAGVAPFLRAYWDVRFRATEVATERAASADIWRDIHLLKAADRLPLEKIRREFVYDLVAAEEEKLQSGSAEPIHGLETALGEVFRSLTNPGEKGLAIVGPPLSGTSTLVTAVAREVAKRRLGQPSCCPPHWRDGELLALRMERLIAFPPQKQILIAAALFRLSRQDPQRVRLVIDHRLHFSLARQPLLTTAILDALQAGKIGTVMVMGAESFAEIGRLDAGLTHHIRRYDMPPFAPEALRAILWRTIRAGLEDFGRSDGRFADVRFASPPEELLAPLVQAGGDQPQPTLESTLRAAWGFPEFLRERLGASDLGNLVRPLVDETVVGDYASSVRTTTRSPATSQKPPET